MHLSERERRVKLVKLAAIEGFASTDELLADAIYDSACPGICTRLDCDYTREVEPDQDEGYCEACQTRTVQSALMLAGLI